MVVIPLEGFGFTVGSVATAGADGRSCEEPVGSSIAGEGSGRSQRKLVY
jgi:hypothetical protein